MPYILEGAAKSRLEGHTQADALILDETTGCAAVFEAKVLSDTSYQVKYDTLRNQLVRNIDCMLEANPDLPEPLSHRDPQRSMFVLLTPRLFKEHPAARLYGWLMQEYRDNPSALARDLPHRDHDWESVSRRLGWLTWEDCEEVLPGACRWLSGASTTARP